MGSLTRLFTGRPPHELALPAGEPSDPSDGLGVAPAGAQEPSALNQLAAAAKHQDEGDDNAAIVATAHAAYILALHGAQGVSLEAYQRAIGRVMGNAFEPDDQGPQAA